MADRSLSAEQARSAERPSLSACKDAEDWMNGAKAHPLSIGYETVTQATAESSISLQCYMLDESNSTPVCADSKQRGLLD